MKELEIYFTVKKTCINGLFEKVHQKDMQE